MEISRPNLTFKGHCEELDRATVELTDASCAEDHDSSVHDIQGQNFFSLLQQEERNRKWTTGHVGCQDLGKPKQI